MSTQLTQLAQQLTSLSDTLKASNALITRLAKLTFQPGSEPLESQSSVRVELTQDIHDSLKQLDEDLELLKQEVEDLNGSSNNSYSSGGGGSNSSARRIPSEKAHDRTRLTAQVARLTEDLRTSRSRFRKAQLSAKRSSEAAKQKEREVVFASLSNPPPQQSPNTSAPDLFANRRQAQKQKNLSKEDLEVDASSSVTAALRRTHNLLSTELSRSRFAQETLDESTAALAELGEGYASLETILANSRTLLGTLVRSQKSDTWYLETAFYLLVGTLVWLVFRRVLLGPFVRLPLFVVRSGVFVLNWAVWKPLFVLLKVTGVVATTTVAAVASSSAKAARAATQTSSRTPLIVQPSAVKGSIPKFSDMAERMPKWGIPGGAGGANAKVGKDAVLEGKMSEAIGRMAEEGEGEGEGGREEVEVVRRGDGTVLQERGDVPRNRKKKVFEDENLGEQEARGRGKNENKRDEL